MSVYAKHLRAVFLRQQKGPDSAAGRNGVLLKRPALSERLVDLGSDGLQLFKMKLHPERRVVGQLVGHVR